jgi:hypothetical protein
MDEKDNPRAGHQTHFGASKLGTPLSFASAREGMSKLDELYESTATWISNKDHYLCPEWQKLRSPFAVDKSVCHPP